MKVYTNLYLLNLLEINHLDYRYRVVIVRGAVASGICHIHVVIDNFHFFRLITHRNFPRDGKRKCIDLIYCTFGCVWVNQHRSDIGADISLSAMKPDITAIGNINLAESDTRTGIQNFDLVRAVDHNV